MPFTKNEMNIANQILDLGLEKAATSLSFFTKNKVEIKALDLKMESLDNVDKYLNRNGEQELYVLSTELLGELTGDCFLIFDHNEVEELLKTSLPPKILENIEMKNEMKREVLLELDNIVSASVITQLSNILECKVHGGVPHLNVVMANDVKELLKEKSKLEYLFCFKADFQTENVELHPEFIWGLDDKFIEGVKNIAKNGELLEKLKNLVNP